MRQLYIGPRSLTIEALRSLVQAFIHCRLDYCNALLRWFGQLVFYSNACINDVVPGYPETLRTGRQCLLSSLVAVCINWVYPPARNKNINRTAKFYVVYNPILWNIISSALRGNSFTAHVRKKAEVLSF